MPNSFHNDGAAPDRPDGALGSGAQAPRRVHEAGDFDARRLKRQVERTWSMVRDTVLDRVLTSPGGRRLRADIERQARDGELTLALAVQQILDVADQR